MQNKIYSVAEINLRANDILLRDEVLPHFMIKGEISNCKYHSSGHIYFTLKDRYAAIPAMMFQRYTISGLDFRLKDGQSVIIEGSVGIYEKTGSFRLNATRITLSGAGDLYAKYEELKQKLYEEGLFDFEVKKEIPKYPKAVGIVTAKTGAAIQDILNIAKRRNPYVQLYLYPAKVQGEGAALTIAKGIKSLDQMGLDIIIVGRGGGSIEDLWAFNEEIVARAIYEAKTPIISGTGHEIDNTIADYAADLRAPTPSAACELAIPDIVSVLEDLDETKRRMDQLCLLKIANLRQRLSYTERQLRLLSPNNRLNNNKKAVEDLKLQLNRAIKDKLEKRKHALLVMTERLNGLSPTAKLVNGFGYLEVSEGQPLKSSSEVKEGDEITITIHDGKIHTKVAFVENKS